MPDYDTPRTENLAEKLQSIIKEGTPAERKIAKFFIEHSNHLAAETASSVADKLDLSPMTVGRFLRSLGFSSIDGVKIEFTPVTAAASWRLSEAIEQLRENAAVGEPLAAIIAEQIDLMHHLYGLAAQQQWVDAVERVVSATTVFIACHESFTDIAHRFCHNLSLSRSSVSFFGAGEKAYSRLLADVRPDTLVIIIRSPGFANAEAVAQAARRLGAQVLMLMAHCPASATDASIPTLALPISRPVSLDLAAPLLALLETFSFSVYHKTGEAGKTRTRRIVEFESMFASDHGGGS